MLAKMLAASGAAVVMSALVASGSAQATNLVLNGGFDLNTPPAGTAPLDWTLTNAASGSDFFVGPTVGFPTASPPNSANFGATGAENDQLEQFIPTTPGRTYEVSFWLAHDSTNNENDFIATFDGHSILDLVDASAFGYTRFSGLVTAVASSTDLAFSGRDVPAWFGLDNVSVSEIPEPTTWAMMLLGFAGLGFAGYRRARVAASAV